MKKEFSCFMIFIAGAAVGSLATMRYFKTKYEKIAQDEIDSVKEAFRISKGIDKKDNPATSQEDLKEMASKLDYSSFSQEIKGGEEMKDLEDDKPYLIAPSRVGDDEYDCITFTYHSDKVLVNELNEVIEGKELESLLGSTDVFKYFGYYEDDVIYVRNDVLKTDFEILRDLEPYEE